MQTLKSTGLCLDVRAAPGNKFLDVSRYHHTIANNNVVTAKGLGSSLAGKYNGVDAYLNCGNHSSLNITDAITIEAWVKMNDINDGIIASKIDRNIDESWQIWVDTTLTKFKFAVNDGSYKHVAASPTITTGVWYHIACVADGTNITVYQDGVTGIPLSCGYPESTVEPIRIGIRKIGGILSTLYFNGTIFLARIYSRALPAYEIENHYYEYAAYLGKQ